MPEDIENLRWLIGVQKEDILKIKNQMRRYIFGVLTITVLILGVAVSVNIPILSYEETATNLAEQGLLWGFGILGPEHASDIVYALYPITVAFFGFGIMFVVMSIWGAYHIEMVPEGHPLGNAADYRGQEIEKVNEWIRENDYIIDKIVEHRDKAFANIKRGVVIMLLSLTMMLILSVSVIMFSFVLFVSIIYSYNIYSSIEYSPDIYHTIMIFCLIAALLVRPVSKTLEYVSRPILGILIVGLLIGLILGRETRKRFFLNGIETPNKRPRVRPTTWNRVAA